MVTKLKIIEAPASGPRFEYLRSVQVYMNNGHENSWSASHV